MRILHLTVDYPPPIRGGLPRQVQGLARALVGAGHDAAIAAIGEDRQDGEIQVYGAASALAALPTAGLERLPAINLGLSSAATRAFASGTWDLVHAHDWMVAPGAAIASRSAGIPVVATFHADAGAVAVGSDDDRLRRLDWERALVAVAQRSIACGPGLADALRERHPGHHIAYTPNGIDRTRFERRSVDRRTRSRRVLFVGRLVPYKGCQDLIEAVGLLRRDWPDIELRIVGDGYGRSELEKLVMDLQLNANVAFIGWLEDDDLEREYQQATMLVLPSHEEAFGLVGLEAMAAGLPVVATQTGVFNEVVEDRASALLVPPGDPPAIAQAIDKLLRKPALRHRLAALAKQRIVPQFSWERVVVEVVRHYEDALAAA